jgi:hypothetical protein
MQALSAPADSLVIVEMMDPATTVSSLFLNMGLTNGVLLRTTIDTITGSLTDTRQRFLGAKSVKLFPVTIGASPAVLALSSRPWLSYSFQSSTKLSPLSYSFYSFHLIHFIDTKLLNMVLHLLLSNHLKESLRLLETPCVFFQLKNFINCLIMLPSNSSIHLDAFSCTLQVETL